MANDVQVFSASQVIPFDDPSIECAGDRLSIERGQGSNIYRVWYPLGEAAPSVLVSKGSLQPETTGSELRTTYPQFSAEEQLPDNTIIHWAVGEGEDTLYYGVREESVEWSFAEYLYFGNTSEDEPPAFMLATAVYTHEGTDRPCLAITFSQISVSDAACSGVLSIERGEGGNVYRVWYPLGSTPPSIRVSKGGLEYVGTGTDTKITYPTFSGVEELPTEGTILISQEITVGDTTLYYGVQELEEEYSYVEYGYFGVISENEAPAFMIAYGVYEDPDAGALCPVFASTQVSMSDDTCSAAISIEGGTGENVYRIWYPLGGSPPLVQVSRGRVVSISSGSEVRTTYPQFSGEAELPENTIISYTKTSEDGATQLYYGVRREDTNTAFVDYLFVGNSNPGTDPVFILAFGIYEDPETGQPCVGFATSQVSERDTSSCEVGTISIERGDKPDEYKVLSQGGCNPTVRVSQGHITRTDSGTESRESYRTFSGVERRDVEGTILMSFTANGLLYGIAKVTDRYNVDVYKYEGAIRGVGEPAYMLAYCIANGTGTNDNGTQAKCVALTSAEVGIDSSQLCESRINISKGENPNEVVVYVAEGINREPSVKLSKGSLSLLRTSGALTRQEPRVFQNEKSLPSGQIVLQERIGDLYYGVVLEDITETAYTYGYTPPPGDLPYLCLDEDDPDYANPPEPAHMFAWAVYPPKEAIGQVEDCVAFASFRVSYDCPQIPQCDEPIELSISSGQKANTVVATYAPSGVSPVFQAINGTIGDSQGTITEEVQTVVQFSGEAQSPDTAVAAFQIGNRWYGWKTETKVVNITTYGISMLSGSEEDSADVTIYGYIAAGPCMALASATVPAIKERAELYAKYGTPPAKECWVQLEHKDSELLFVAYERIRGGSPIIGSVNCGLVYRGKDTSEVEKIVEYAEELEVPDGAIFVVKRPSYSRYGFETKELYYGFRRENTESVRDIYEIVPDDPEGKEVMYAYAYFGNSEECSDYAQIMIPPSYEEEQHEEYEAYRVVSRIIITDKGAFQCPAPDKQEDIDQALEDGQVDTYLIDEIVHEQGYISQLWNRTGYARPERHDHPFLQRYPILSSLMPTTHSDPDRYFVWADAQSMLAGNSSVVPGGRPISVVFGSLTGAAQGDVPAGVKRRWPNVRLLDR
jgi:hypothetical protein